MARRKQSQEWQQSEDEEEDYAVNAKQDIEVENEYESDHLEENETGNKFAQFLDSDDEEDIDEESESQDSMQSSEEEEEDHIDSNKRRNNPQTEEQRIRKQMENIPFAALAKANRAMLQSKEEEDEDDSEPDEFQNDRNRARERQEKKTQHLIEKRDSKHAPTELSSRRPVSRKRSVVETANAERRDPRFSSLSASLTNKGLFRSSYGFLREQQSSEVQELKQTLSKLKRQEKHQAGPKAKSEAALRLREEREQVELALRREEGRENERIRRERKDEVLSKAKKSIEERVKQGGKRYFLKESDKKKLVLQDKFEHLSGGGGENGKSSFHTSLKRAVERRRKKNSAKDRQMPLGGGAFQGGGAVSFGDTSMPLPKRKRARNH